VIGGGAGKRKRGVVRVDQFDFQLPQDRIALEAVEPRDAARLLVVKPGAPFEDRIVRDLATLLRPGDVIVVNDTRVIAAALAGVRLRDGVASKVAFNLIKRVDGRRWRAFARPAKRLVGGDRVTFARGETVIAATISGKFDAGEVELAFELQDDALVRAIEAVGDVPLPPYIALKRAVGRTDLERYQTVFAAKAGAVAAPTAGLHMTEALLAELAARGIGQATVTLHVGAGTFLPVKADDTRDHMMHSEWCEVSAETAAALRAARANGGRIVAIGTTALRTLESAAAATGEIAAYRGETSIFITPGYRFRVVDALLTNFHLPRSTLFMLVSAFAGLDVMQRAYQHAITSGYRFYSYGDTSLLLRDPAAS
jgi:S-adenosylmethionine:tRNA ribosyltransferase-isomerase